MVSLCPKTSVSSIQAEEQEPPKNFSLGKPSLFYHHFLKFYHLRTSCFCVQPFIHGTHNNEPHIRSLENDKAPGTTPALRVQQHGHPFPLVRLRPNDWLMICQTRHQPLGASGFQQLEQFRARHEQLSAQCSAYFQFAAFDESVNAKIIDAQQIGCLLHRVGQSLGRGGRFFCF